MAIELPYYPILKIPDSEPDAIPELWNATYEQIDENLIYLQSEFNSALLSISDLTSQLANALLAISDLESQLAGATNPDTGGGGDTSGGENSGLISTTVIFEGRATEFSVLPNGLYLVTIQWGPNESDTMIDGFLYDNYQIYVAGDVLKGRFTPSYYNEYGQSVGTPYVVRKVEKVNSWNGESLPSSFNNSSTIFIGEADNYIIRRPGIFVASVNTGITNPVTAAEQVVQEIWVVPDLNGDPWDGRQGRGEETFSHISRVEEVTLSS